MYKFESPEELEKTLDDIESEIDDYVGSVDNADYIDMINRRNDVRERLIKAYEDAGYDEDAYRCELLWR